MSLRLEVVVLDDMSRFAGHVWQYLAQGMGFGIGRMSDDGRGEGADELTLQERKPLPIPSGEARVRWINAGASSWYKDLQAALKVIADKPSCFLVDVRGPIRASRAGYRWEDAVRLVWEGPQPDATIFLVSSYLTGTRLFRSTREEEFVIRPKSWKTLEKVARLVHTQTGKLTGLHILVTGAGFERAQDLGGAHGMGMPSTHDILERGWNGCGYGDSFERNGYPIPRKLVRGWRAEELKALRKAAKAGNLDVYWNEALRLVLERARRSSRKTEVRDQKIAASLEEYKVRETFRQAFLNYDWGHLNQALDAAALGWTAWLSTNYTSFADRALVLAERSDKPGWAIVSTSNEAIQLSRNILHGDKRGPVLFKLHGHIEHLLTMAIAGHDKELYSTLSLPVDSLHEVYTAAELFLKRRLEIHKSRVVWHIVGHSLRDALLLDILIRVCRSRDHAHQFLFVGPDVTEKVEEKRRELFRSLELPPHSFVGVKLYADEYLARLRRFGLSARACRNLGAWRDRLVSPLTVRS